MRKYRRQLLAAGAAGATAVALAVGPVGAQTGNEGDGPPSSEEIEERRAEHEAHRGEFHVALAEELGVSVEELEAAVERVRNAQFEERLAEKVEAGELTEEEADEIREARESGTLHELRREQMLERLDERLAERVEAGELTEEEAEEIRERAENGERPRRFDGRGPGRRGARGSGPGGPGGVDRPNDGGSDTEAEGTSVVFV